MNKIWFVLIRIGVKRLRERDGERREKMRKEMQKEDKSPIVRNKKFN